MDETKLLSQIQVKRGATTAYPWIEPPIMLAAPPRKIPDWEFRTDPKDPNIKLTPPIPWIDCDLVKTETEMMSLAPYGSTHLQLTIFPETKLPLNLSYALSSQPEP